MSRELDRRPLVTDEAGRAREQELQSVAEAVSAQLPGDQSVRITHFDHTTGVPRVVTSEDAPVESGQFVHRALAHVEAIAPVLGLVHVQPEYRPDEQVQRTASGAASVHLQQQHEGIPIFQATETVRFNADGSLRDTAGSSVPIAGAVATEPQLGVIEAVRRAAEQVAQPDADELGHTDQFGEAADPVGLDLHGFEPTIEEQDTGSSRATVLSGRPFEDIRAALLWFPMPDGLHLSWEVLLTFPSCLARYRVVVDAAKARGEVLYCHQLVRTFAASGNVYRVDGSTPRQQTDFPPPLSGYPMVSPLSPLPAGFPEEWVVGQETSGNCTCAHLDASGATLQGTTNGATVVFDPIDPTGDEQKVLNIFYFACYMHDFTYLLGFREREGNFQQDNFGRGGLGGDAVDARAHAGAVPGTANMATLDDGEPPVMNMGLVTNTNRHTAFDSSVVFHEFMHGVTNRMVGGPADSRSLESPQSRGMGEGWSDWIACTINGTDVVGAWVVGNLAGIRQHAYDDNYPDDFSKLGTGVFGPGGDEHAVGEIWCATLMALNRKLGVPLTLQLVIDALQLSAANPSFLNMRDDILAAADQMNAAKQLTASLEAVKADVWQVFAARGMGPGAHSQGAQLAGIVADYRVPTP
jgi:extracellular elastinolytic metalloproteinase